MFADDAQALPRIRGRWIPFAAFAVVLLPLCLPVAASVPAALLALGVLLVLLTFHVRAFANWLIILAVGLTLLPALYIAFVLVQRLQGAPAQLTAYVIIAQGNRILAQSLMCTVLFVAAMACGWLLHAGPEAETAQPALNPVVRWSPFALAALVAFWAFALVSYSMQAGSSVLVGGYVLNGGHALIYSGMWMVMANFAMLLLEINRWRRPRLARNACNIFWGAEFLVCLLHGDRVDLLAGCVILLCCRIRGLRRQTVAVALFSVVAVPALTFFAVFRQLAASGLVSVSAMAANAESNLRNLRDIGDLGDLSVTTAAGLYMVESGRRPLSYGQSYARYLVRLTPTFLRPQAPDDGEKIFQTYGLDTNGGMTPVSEAYFNFGFLGPALIGFAHGWLIAWLYLSWLRKRAAVWTCVFFLATAYSFRAYFYDTFDLIKAEVFFLLLFASLTALNRLVRPAAPGRVEAPAPAG